MTYQFNQNITPVTGCDAIFQWKQFMVANGWSIVASGDGISAYSNSGNVITSGNQKALGTAGSLFNTQAWFVIEQPAGGRQFSFQAFPSVSGVNTNAVNWRIKYSVSGFNVFTHATYKITPTASIDGYTGVEDAVVLYGSPLGTDATPTASPLFNPDGSYRMQMMMDNDDGYGFYWFNTTIATTQQVSGFVFDELMPGTYPMVEQDPYIIYATGPTSAWLTAGTFYNFGSGPAGYIKRGMLGQAFVTIAGPAYGTSTPGSFASTVIGGLPSNPLTDYDDLLPMVYARPQVFNNVAGQTGLPCGYKGVSLLMKWLTTARTTLDMLTLVNPGDKIVCGNVVLPWNNITPIV